MPRLKKNKVSLPSEDGGPLSHWNEGDEPRPKRDIKALIATINKKFGGEGRIVIQQGVEITYAQAERLSTGSLGLDIALNGGVPKGMVVQFMGEESAGKTTMAFKVAAGLQEEFGPDTVIAWVAVEGFDKKWANQCGCRIAFSAEELKLMSREEQNQFDMIETVGEFVLVQAVTGEDALEVALDFIRSGTCHLVVIDSIAALVPASEEEREMSENTMGKLPALVGKFLRKCGSALSARREGRRNETAIILINQVREVIGTYGHPEPQGPGGRSLRHWSVATVRFKKGEVLKAEESDEKMAYGKRTKIRVEKSKIGPPFREAEFEFYFRPHDGFAAGDINLYQEVRIWGTRAGTIEQTNNRTWEIDGKKIVGKDAVDQWLRDHPKECEVLRKNTLAALTSGRQ